MYYTAPRGCGKCDVGASEWLLGNRITCRQSQTWISLRQHPCLLPGWGLSVPLGIIPDRASDKLKTLVRKNFTLRSWP